MVVADKAADLILGRPPLASISALRVAREAVQLHGGMGYTDAADIGLYLKAALRLGVHLGTPEAHRARFMAGAAP
jgi:alkylation response protein AidB-like acyl-CoA dehydrogenase